MGRHKQPKRSIQEVFEYDTSSPSCIVRKLGYNKGSTGNLRPDWYYRFGFDNKSILAHHVVLILHGIEPPDGMVNVVDHIDRDRGNNRIENLRITNKSGNAYNTGLESRNSSGHKGVSFCKRDNKWRAFIRHKGKFISKYCSSKEEAIEHANLLRSKYV